MDSSSWWTAPWCCIKFSKSQGTIGRVTSSENGPQILEVSISSCARSNLCSFTLKELSKVTGEFSQNNLIGEGGFGPVYRGFINGTLRPGIESQLVAVKLLNLDGSQGNKEWLSEVMILGKLRHPHLARLIGYCYENEHRLLVYEYMPNGSLENHLFQRIITSLPWSTRLKILVGAAKGLAFLHGAEKPVIYRDFKASNILLDSDFTAKLSDFGFAKDGPVGDNTHISTRVMGTEGYTAPEYIMTGHLTVKSDVYSFGVVLLELLTGRRSVDRKRRSREQNLVEWARPSLNDAMKLSRIMDPSLDGIYSTAAAQRAAAMAYQCLSQNPKTRPHMSSIVDILESLVDLNDGMPGSFVFTVISENSAREENERGNANNNKGGGVTRRYNFMRMR